MIDNPAAEQRPLPPWGFRPYVHLTTKGPAGNIFAMLAECRRQARAARKTTAQIEQFSQTVMATKSYHDAIATIEAWLTVTWIDDAP